MDVSIIIVNYNTRELTSNCIESIFSLTQDIDFELILVDNNSSDNSQYFFKNDPRIIFLQNSKNLGFGKACNLASKIAKGKYLLFINSDCVILNNAINLLFYFFDQYKDEPKIGVLGAYLLNEDKSFATSYFKFPDICSLVKSEVIKIHARFKTKTLLRDNSINYKGLDGGLEVECVSGALMMINGEVFEKFNGFDESYFLYFEETDLQNRMVKKGLKNFIIDTPEIIHFEAKTSSDNFSFINTKALYAKSMFQYFKKNHSFFEYIVLKILIVPLFARFIFMTKYSFQDRKDFFKTILLS